MCQVWAECWPTCLATSPHRNRTTKSIWSFGTRTGRGSRYSGKWYLLKLVSIPLYLKWYVFRVTLNIEADTIQFVKAGGPTEQLTLTEMCDTSSKRCVPGAVHGAGFTLIDSLLCLHSRFEYCTFCIAEYTKILLLCAIWQNLFNKHHTLSGKAKLSITSCEIMKRQKMEPLKITAFMFLE